MGNMYDSIGKDYDLFVNWPERLAVEMLFIKEQVQQFTPLKNHPIKILDAACGTGMHAVELARCGFETAGADLSGAMINQAFLNAQNAGVKVNFKQAGFGELEKTFRQGQGEPICDAMLCLGNSLPHLQSLALLDTALSDMAACLAPGGVLIIQNRNLDRVVAKHERWMEPQADHTPETDILFFRFYDFEADGSITFNIATLTQHGKGAWKQKIDSTRLFPFSQNQFIETLEKNDFKAVTSYGNLMGNTFDLNQSGNLVITARRK